MTDENLVRWKVMAEGLKAACLRMRANRMPYARDESEELWNEAAGHVEDGMGDAVADAILAALEELRFLRSVALDNVRDSLAFEAGSRDVRDRVLKALVGQEVRSRNDVVSVTDVTVAVKDALKGR